MANATPLLGHITNATQAEIENCSIRRSWREGAAIFRHGEACNALHLVETGLVKLYLANAEGREQILSVCGPRCALTLIPLLDGGTYATSACALVESTTWYLPRERFNFLFATRSDFRDAVLSEVGATLRSMVTLADSISLRRVPARVAARLLEQAESAGAASTSLPFRLKLTQEDLAHLVGSTRESVARALGQFRAAGLIEQRGPRIRILDCNGLMQIARGAEDSMAAQQPLSA